MIVSVRRCWCLLAGHDWGQQVFFGNGTTYTFYVCRRCGCYK